VENPISQPSAHEREEFFSGPAEYPAEPAAHSPVTELSSGPAEGIAVDGQSGGGGGLRPLSAPAPSDPAPWFADVHGALAESAPEAKGPGVGGYSPLRIREADRDADLAHGCALKLSPVDILSLKQEQDRQAAMVRRNEQLIEVVFAARQLAQSQLVRIAETGKTICANCGGMDSHASRCEAHRVLQALARLEETAGETPSSAGAIDQADGATGGAALTPELADIFLTAAVARQKGGAR
jgi:hypothetical protein